MEESPHTQARAAQWCTDVSITGWRESEEGKIGHLERRSDQSGVPRANPFGSMSLAKHQTEVRHRSVAQSWPTVDRSDLSWKRRILHGRRNGRK
jgi:hypothetical protein